MIQKGNRPSVEMDQLITSGKTAVLQLDIQYQRSSNRSCRTQEKMKTAHEKEKSSRVLKQPLGKEKKTDVLHFVKTARQKFLWF